MAESSNPNTRRFTFSTPEPISRGSWWLDLPRPHFYPVVLERTKELNPKYGCAEIRTGGITDASLSERFWRHKQNTRGREERAMAS